MTLDYELKEQKDLNFIHGHVVRDKTMDAVDCYKINLDQQWRTMYRQKYYNSYLVSTDNNEIKTYSTSLSSYSTKAELLSLEKRSIVMLRNFWDYDYIESLGLPLYWKNPKTNKNNINPQKENIDYGCYISSSQAYKIALDMKLIDENSDIAAVKNAFDQIIDRDNDYFLSVDDNTKIYTFTINNIYIDSKFLNWLPASERSYYSRFYGTYNSVFDFWNNNAIVTHAPHIFMRGCNLYFDIRGSYNNIDLFIDNVLGRRYAEDGTTIHFETQTEKLEKLSSQIDESCKYVTTGEIAYLLLSIAFFELLIIFHFVNLTARKINKNKFHSFFILFLPFLPFLITWLSASVFLMFVKNFQLIYSCLNYTGNAVSLILITAAIVGGFIWRSIDDENKKIV